MKLTLTAEQCQQARLARDARFDGVFFTAVKTTGIFCRPICPAIAPKEKNVEYFGSAAQASQAGYRPCLRCRPDSAPESWAWRGAETTFQRALKLIDGGALQEASIQSLSARLGITDRYLRQLFKEHLGMSPKQYAQFQQLMFAKQLLHNSCLSIGDIGLASGFQSVRRFNDAFKKVLKLTPSEVRKSGPKHFNNRLQLTYRPPLNWQYLLNFYQQRLAVGVEAIHNQRYSRSFAFGSVKGWFAIEPKNDHAMMLEFSIDDMTQLKILVKKVRRIFDLDVDIQRIEKHLADTSLGQWVEPGIRIPGVFSAWEAGVRAILGQQVSVKAAIKHLNHLVEKVGRTCSGQYGIERLFPEPIDLTQADLSFLKMPNARKETLKRFAEYMKEHLNRDPVDWLTIKGIGPWTIQYARLRGLSEPNHFLSTDLVIKKALNTLPEFDIDTVSPWGSYATFHCWNSQ